jgi:pilus assembly protein CpaE
MPVGPTPTTRPGPGADSTTRAGNVIAVYSPQGGAGVTTIATSLASGLMKEGIKVLLIDADLQFADVSAFLNLQAQSTIVELAPDVDDMDVELFENIVVTHESGLKVLAGPQRPEMAEEVASKPNTVAQIISKVAPNYDFVIVDTATSINEVLLGIFDQATKIILVTTPYFVNVKNMRMVLDLFDQLGYDADKAKLVLNHVWEDRKGKSATIAPERVQSYLKRDIIGRVPHVDERMLLSAINKGVPVIASDRDQNKPPIKQLVDLSNLVYTMLMGEEEEDVLSEEESKKRNFSLFGR